MKGYLLATAILISCLASSAPVIACEKFQTKADRYTALKRQGGSAKQMTRWTAQRKLYNERYRECLKAKPRIQSVARSPKAAKIKTDRQPRRSLESENPITLKLLATCNFWIDTYNTTPSPDNKSYRNSACRALDEALQETPTLAAQPPTQRAAKDCVKPGNLYDDDVRECMTGERAPDWN